jgi:site-specific recombinase XerD
MDGLFGVRMSGPLTPYAAGFAVELARLGYTPLSARDQLRLVAHLSRWLQGQGLDVAAVSAGVVEGFLAARRAGGYRAHLHPASLEPLLVYLRGVGVVAAAPVAARTPAQEVMSQFREYLILERGLTVQAARGYVGLVGPFVAARVGARGVDLQRVTAGEVSAFMVAAARRLPPRRMQLMGSALRALLRWWHVEGVLATSLVEAVPKVASRYPLLPRALEPGQVAALLSSCDRQRVAGRRDYAMLMLMSRLGLRCGEVAALELEDIDWRAGQITVRGKGNRRDLLPLPVDVGQAVADYLQAGRPAMASGRWVFVRVKAPRAGLTGRGVSWAVRAAGQRSGLGVIGGHRLRHSAATSMLSAGGSLAEIGQVLRHRRPQTTAIYTKVDVEALRALARPWPRAAS